MTDFFERDQRNLIICYANGHLWCYYKQYWCLTLYFFVLETFYVKIRFYCAQRTSLSSCKISAESVPECRYYRPWCVQLNTTNKIYLLVRHAAVSYLLLYKITILRYYRYTLCKNTFWLFENILIFFTHVCMSHLRYSFREWACSALINYDRFYSIRDLCWVLSMDLRDPWIALHDLWIRSSRRNPSIAQGSCLRDRPIYLFFALPLKLKFRKYPSIHTNYIIPLYHFTL